MKICRRGVTKCVPKRSNNGGMAIFFAILGGLLMCPIFDETLVGKKCTKNQKNEGQGRPKRRGGQQEDARERILCAHFYILGGAIF